MASFAIGDQLLQEKLFDQEKEIPQELDSTIQAQRRVLREAYELFTAHYGPAHVSDLSAAIAPGRVNLIGEHVDYCDGFVLPMAIPLYTALIGRKKPDRNSVTLYSSHFKEPVELKRPFHQDRKEYPAWSRYVRGVLSLSNFLADDVGLEVVVHSLLPPGAGLSSSAALELATLLFLRQFRKDSDTSDLNGVTVEGAVLCQKVEHDFAKVPCGIMDQLVVAVALPSHAVKIDCRSITFDHIPIAISADAVFMVTNSGVKHSHASGEYAKRRANVEKAVELLGVPSWRDVSHELIRSKSGSFDPDTNMLANAIHVVDEIERTIRAANALLDNNIILFGKLMTESHVSLKEKYNVSCAELDELVDIALQVPGVFGSRMTGGGFGGCTVTLVKRDAVSVLEENIRENYTGGEPTFFICDPVGGAAVASLDFLNN